MLDDNAFSEAGGKSTIGRLNFILHRRRRALLPQSLLFKHITNFAETFTGTSLEDTFATCGRAKHCFDDTFATRVKIALGCKDCQGLEA